MKHFVVSLYMSCKEASCQVLLSLVR